MMRDPQKQAAARYVSTMKIVKTTGLLLVSVRVKAQRSLFILSASLVGLSKESNFVQIAYMKLNPLQTGNPCESGDGKQ